MIKHSPSIPVVLCGFASEPASSSISTSAMILEIGDYLLLESGDNIFLEEEILAVILEDGDYVVTEDNDMILEEG